MSAIIEPLAVDVLAEAEAEAGASPPADPVSEAGMRARYAYSRRIACLSDPEGPVAESFRALQTHLSAGHVRDGRRGLALCAPAPGSGCTTVAVNLAVAFAQAGTSTLLVDANLHRPAVHDFIRPAAPAAGLAEMLAAGPDQRLDEVHRDVRPNLAVLFAGEPTPRSRDLVATRQFKQIIDDCMRHFEITIVDTPSLRSGTDARRIAMAVRYGLVIARRDMTLVSDIRAAADELSTDRVQLIGSFITAF